MRSLHVGQFWDIPVNIKSLEDEFFVGDKPLLVNITSGSSTRSFVGLLGPPTGENKRGPCLHLSEDESYLPELAEETNHSVIEGTLWDYIVPGPFLDNFKFGMFDNMKCKS